MIISRGLGIAQRAAILAKGNSFRNSNITRNSHDGSWYYRTGVKPYSKRFLLIPEVIAGVAWWWVLWHLWTDFDHITGEFEFPDVKKWTDEELGIPPC